MTAVYFHFYALWLMQYGEWLLYKTGGLHAC